MVDATNASQFVGWLIETVDDNWPDGDRPDTLQLIDRDNSKVYDGVESLRQRESKLEEANYVSFAKASSTDTPRGPGYDLEREPVVSARVEGLHEDQFGKVADAAAFEQLWRNIREAIYTDRRRPLPDYHTLFIQNIRHASGNYRDYFRTDFEVRFWGGEELP